MKFTLAKEREYIPTWEGNDKQEEPIKFTLRYLNTVERDDIISPQFGEDGKVNIKPNYIKAFKLGVSKIEGFNVDGSQVKTSIEFLKLTGFYELFLEVAGQVLMQNSVVDGKNLL